MIPASLSTGQLTVLAGGLNGLKFPAGGGPMLSTTRDQALITTIYEGLMRFLTSFCAQCFSASPPSVPLPGSLEQDPVAIDLLALKRRQAQ